MLFTREPYAAVTFREFATPGALLKLKPLIERIDASSLLSSGAHIRCPADQELWDFQKASVSYALNQDRTLVADQPGLGKTPIAICFANEIRAKRVLCIVPANIRGQWEKRIRQWTTMPWPYNIYPIYHGRHGVHPTANWTIVSYDLARSPPLLAALCKGTYDLLVIDEGHMLKNEASKRTRAVFGCDHDPALIPLVSRCGAVMVLTGTPLPNRPARGVRPGEEPVLGRHRLRQRRRLPRTLQPLAHRGGRAVECREELHGDVLLHRRAHWAPR
jgi:SNF2 family DNA or RNA helicase